MLMNIILYLLSIIQYLYQQNCWLINFICRYIPVSYTHLMLEEQKKELEFLNAMLSDRLTLARRKRFGASSEKYADGYTQLNLFNEAEKEADADAPVSYTHLDVYKRHVLKVPNNYHIEYDGHYYSVLYSYCGKPAILKATASEIRICDQYNRLICTHKRSYREFPLYITVDEHMPPEHLYYNANFAKKLH